MAKDNQTNDNKKDYDSTTNEPFKPQKSDHTTWENPDKTKKKEKNDPTREPNPDITSQPGNKKGKEDDSDDDIEGSIMNRTEV